MENTYERVIFMSNNIGDRIPKKIHYCWFGGKHIPDNLQRCIDSWKRLEGYEIIRWDESNCSFDENEFVKKAYAEKKLGFIGDYYRLKAIYEHGGIYLDTDVEVFNDFEPLLSDTVFFGFNYDCCIGTGIIGSVQGAPYIKKLMDLYDNTVFGETTNGKQFQLTEDDKVILTGFETSNYYHTVYVLKYYKDLQFNNTYQDMGDFRVYPKEYFEIGMMNKKQYTIHYNTGSWMNPDDKSGSGIKSFIKKILAKNPYIWYKAQIIARRNLYYRLNKTIPFYPQYVAQKKGLEVPPVD